MPYIHRENAVEYASYAETYENIDHLKIHDLHNEPAGHETEHLMSAIGEIKVGEPFSSYFPGPSVAYIIEGELEGVCRSKPGEKFTAKKGDVVHFESDSHITWNAVQDVKFLGVTYVQTSLKSLNDLVIPRA